MDIQYINQSLANDTLRTTRSQKPKAQLKTTHDSVQGLVTELMGVSSIDRIKSTQKSF